MLWKNHDHFYCTSPPGSLFVAINAIEETNFYYIKLWIYRFPLHHSHIFDVSIATYTSKYINICAVGVIVAKYEVLYENIISLCLHTDQKQYTLTFQKVKASIGHTDSLLREWWLLTRASDHATYFHVDIQVRTTSYTLYTARISNVLLEKSKSACNINCVLWFSVSTWN